MATGGDALEWLFPGLVGQPYGITSPKDSKYNCIGWAGGQSQRWWWPDEDGDDLWPSNVPREETLAAFRALFETLGYAVCDHGQLEDGFEKIALYADPNGIPKHAARQLPTGRWTSKLGQFEDIEHDLANLAGADYGTVVLVMKRPLPEW
jgi:hypothetical protein